MQSMASLQKVKRLDILDELNLGTRRDDRCNKNLKATAMILGKHSVKR